jgi:hypothetical protein
MTDTEQTQELHTIGNYVRDLQLQKSTLSTEILKLKEELYQTEFYQMILKKEQELRELEQKEQDTKNNIVNQMLKYDLKSIEFNHQKFTLKRTPVSIVIQDEKDIPDEYRKEKKEVVIDKKSLKEAIQNGLVVDGVEISYSHTLLITPKS